MLDEIGGQLVQPVVGSDDLVILPQQLLQQCLLVGIEIRLFDRRGDPVVQVQSGNAQFFAPVLVDQLDGRPVLFRTLEIVARNVAAENPLGQAIVLEQRRARKADERRIRQGQAHVPGQFAGLRAMRLVRDDDDVVPVAVGLPGIHVLVELVDQAEQIAMVFLQQPFQLFPRCRARRLVVRHPAPHERPEYLVVEVVPVGHQQESELRRHRAPDLLGEKSHRVRLAAALCVPENAQLA